MRVVQTKGSEKMIKLTVLYGQPKDPAAFEEYYATTHHDLVSKVKGIRRLELAKAVGGGDGGEPPYYRIAELYFDDMEQMQGALSSPEGQATVNDIVNFATGGATTFVSIID